MRTLTILSVESNDSLKRFEMEDSSGYRYSLEISSGEVSLYDYYLGKLLVFIPVEFIPFINELLAL